MCYAAPGPRCSAHAEKNLTHAQQVAAEMSGKDFGAYQEAVDNVKVAEKIFDTTPAGIKKLQVALGDAQTGLEQDVLANRLFVATQTRASQITAYKETFHPVDDVVTI
jgi:hypothetical protein